MVPQPVDDLLVQRARRGDRVAMESVLESLAPQIWNIARRLMGNDTDAADASQEALIAVARGLSTFDGRSAVTTWAHRVATNACLDELRRRHRRPVPTEPPPEALATAHHDPNVVDRLEVDRALAALPPDFRAAIVLREVFGHDYDTIAALLDCPIGTVRSRLSRARALLAQELELIDAPLGNFSDPSHVSTTATPLPKDPRR